MKSCNSQAGRQFLDGNLSDEQETRYVAHLDSCSECQSQLEQSAGSGPDWQEARDRLKLLSSLFDTESTDSSRPTGEYDLAFLSPTDDPQMLGRIGPYEVSGVIGRGGMGIVVKALDKSLNRFVAIKVLDPRLASLGVARQRFAREARAMASVSHEHVVPVFAVEEHLGLPYLVMEYISGASLEHKLRKNGPLSTLAIVRVGLQVSQALSAAHAQGLVHRDIKPANILLDKGVERIRVGDFGLARVSHEANCTQTGTVAGTPEFMAPEQVRGETCSPATDLFGLGGLMYAMCSGASPFQAETVYGVMQHVLEKTPKSLREENPEVPIWLEQFIFRLLEKNPQDRFESSEMVAQLLEKELAYLQNPSTAERPNRSWATKGSLAGRRKTYLRSSLVIAVAVMLALAWKFWPGEPEPVTKAPVNGSGLVVTEPSPALWDTDGTMEFAARVWALDEEMRFLPPPHSPPDAWNEDVEDVRRRLSTLRESAW